MVGVANKDNAEKSGATRAKKEMFITKATRRKRRHKSVPTHLVGRSLWLNLHLRFIFVLLPHDSKAMVQVLLDSSRTRGVRGPNVVSRIWIAVYGDLAISSIDSRIP